jgi:hypothetical protein
MDELWNVVAGGQANMNGVFSPGTPIVIFEALSQSVSSDPDDRIHLWIKGFRTA